MWIAVLDGRVLSSVQCIDALCRAKRTNNAVHECSAMQSCSARMECNAMQSWDSLSSAQQCQPHTHTRNICTLLHCTAQRFVGFPKRGGVLCAVPFQFPPDIRSVPLLHPPPRSFHFLEKEPFGRFPDRCQSNFPPQKIWYCTSVSVLSPHQIPFQCHFNFPCKKTCHTEAAKFKISK